MLKLDELKIFITTAQAGSFVRAAEQLQVTPSVISKSIRNLENKLNITVFNRTTRKILITSDGEWLQEHATKTLENLQTIEAHFANHRVMPEGKLTIDAATPFALHVIAPIISSFSDRYPKIEISLVSNETIADLIKQKVDVAIRLGELKDSTLKAKKIGVTCRALYASPAYLKMHGEPACGNDLRHHQCLGFSSPKSLNSWPLRDDIGKWVTIEPYMVANSGETLKQLAIFGNGIICVSEFTIQKELQRGELVPVLESLIKPHPIPIHAVFYTERTVSPHIRVFLDFLMQNTDFLSDG